MIADQLGGHVLTEPVLGGRRRLDRILAPDYLDGLESIPLEEVRSLRMEAEQGEADLSFLRRFLHGRIDILRAELDRRASGATGRRIIDELAAILADRAPSRPKLKRHLLVGPSQLGEFRRTGERLLADVDLSDVTARTDRELRTTLESLATYERAVSRVRRAVQVVVDTCRREIAWRYQIGEAQVADLLSRSGR